AVNAGDHRGGAPPPLRAPGHDGGAAVGHARPAVHPMRTALQVLGRALLVLPILGVAAWAAGALYLGPPQSAVWALAMAAVGLVAAVAAVLPRLRPWPLALFAGALIAFAIRWHGVQPSNDRDWQPDVAVLPYATFDGDLVTIHNVRNFDYRTETD